VIVRGVSRPGGEGPGQDRWTATERSVIVLDGASAFDPAAAPADDYVTALLAAIADRIDGPEPIPAVLAAAIDQAAQDTATTAAGPSSTVAILRESAESVEAAVLGDSTIVIGLVDGHTERLTDDRMSHVAAPDREHYRDRLRTGAGYDEHHRATLGSIQTAERAARNRPSGYWIAESDPEAAAHTITRHYPRDNVSWCVLATDGAQRGIDHLGVPWTDLPTASTEELAALLDELHRWESDADPAGALLPRAKPHDDKTIAIWRPA
jgi:hypothetical protein